MTQTIDLALAGVESDGTRVYDSPLNALGAQVQRGVAELILEYPQETLRVAALVGVISLIAYFASEPQKSARRQWR